MTGSVFWHSAACARRRGTVRRPRRPRLWRSSAVYVRTARIRRINIIWNSMFGDQSRSRLRGGRSIVPVTRRTVPSAHTARLLFLDFSSHINGWRVPWSNRWCFLCDQLYQLHLRPAMFVYRIFNQHRIVGRDSKQVNRYLVRFDSSRFAIRIDSPIHSTWIDRNWFVFRKKSAVWFDRDDFTAQRYVSTVYDCRPRLVHYEPPRLTQVHTWSLVTDHEVVIPETTSCQYGQRRAGKSFCTPKQTGTTSKLWRLSLKSTLGPTPLLSPSGLPSSLTDQVTENFVPSTITSKRHNVPSMNRSSVAYAGKRTDSIRKQANRAVLPAGPSTRRARRLWRSLREARNSFIDTTFQDNDTELPAPVHPLRLRICCRRVSVCLSQARTVPMAKRRITQTPYDIQG